MLSVEEPMAMGSSAAMMSSGTGGMSSSPAMTLSVGTAGASAVAAAAQLAEEKTKLVLRAVPKVGDADSVPPSGGASAYMSEERAVVAVRPPNVSLPLYWKPLYSARRRSACATSSGVGASPAARRRTPPATAP